MGKSLESQFEEYGEVIGAAPAHADRRMPAQWYLRGLLLPGGRKSVEPMAAQVLPRLLKKDSSCHWIADDTGYAKKGTHSVSVGRQYCGRLGKTDNCQVAVSLSIANDAGILPVAYEL